MSIYTCTFPTPLGPMTGAASEERLTGLWFIGQKYYPSAKENWIAEPEYPVFSQLRTYLEAYFAGAKPLLTLQLVPKGTVFQQEIWDLLLAIPYGQVTTYGQLARQLAQRRGISTFSAQAVGGAVGHNPISILIPCHRVVGTGGNLTGYAGGIDKKSALLKLEGAPLEGAENRM